MRRKMLSLAVAAMLLLAGCAAPAQTAQTTPTPPPAATPTPTAQPTPAHTASAAPQAVNMVANGDFSSGKDYWLLYLANGGAATFSNVDGAGAVNITGCGTTDYAVQLYYDGFKLQTGGQYRFSFDVKADVARKILARLQINGGDYHAYVEKQVDVGTDMKHYEIDFKMTEGTDPAPRLCFNIGLPAGQSALAAHTVTFDNVEVALTDGSQILTRAPSPAGPDINVSQIGYEPGDAKIAVLRGKKLGSTFEVVAQDGSVAFQGKVTDPIIISAASGETNYLADFSALKTEGTYTIKSGDAQSYPFDIRQGVYSGAFQAALKMLTLQRCGTELPQSLAGDFAHPACHTGLALFYGTDKTKDVSGGWHDAGDYGRYVVSGAKAVADLLFAYEDFPKALQGDGYGLPESGNGVPDILDEARWELNWMLKMQDADGGVHHKVTGLAFPGEVAPQEETAQQYILPVSMTATGDFAAVMAMSSNIYKPFDPKFAKQCLSAAKKAWGYLDAHGAGNFKNPQDVLTGEYGDNNSMDERYWAAAALYSATGDAKYLQKFSWIAGLYTWVLDGYGWQSVGGYGNKIYLSLKPSATDPALVERIRSAMQRTAESYLENSRTDGYGVSLGMDYNWGSNMTVCDNANYLFLASSLFGNPDYAKAADRHIGYIFGANPMSLCYVTGLGSASPQTPHHRPSMAAGKAMPGMLVGGPDRNQEDPYAKAVLDWALPATCYADNPQSYSTNEVAVYWNSALIYLLAHKMG